MRHQGNESDSEGEVSVFHAPHCKESTRRRIMGHAWPTQTEADDNNEAYHCDAYFVQKAQLQNADIAELWLYEMDQRQSLAEAVHALNQLDAESQQGCFAFARAVSPTGEDSMVVVHEAVGE